MSTSIRATLEKYSAVGVTLTLVGYTIALIVFSNVTGSVSGSRTLTVPVRGLILILLSLPLVFSMRIRKNRYLIWLLAFSILFCSRTLYEWLVFSQLYRPPLEILAYYISFFFAPVILLGSTKFQPEFYRAILNYLVFLGFIFCVLTIYFYGGYLGSTGRISGAIDQTGAYISPLSLSYCSALIISVCTVYIATNKIEKIKYFVFMLLIVLAAVPFFLGASRGSLVAIIFVALFLLLFMRSVPRKALYLVLCVLLGFAIYLSQSILGEGLIKRFMGISQAIQEGSSSAIRLEMWSDALSSFLQAPVLGYGLQSENFSTYPHNVFLEVLLSTGVVGFFVFGAFIISVFNRAVLVIRKTPHDAWIVAIFLVGFAESQFSGSISSAAILAIGSGLVLSYSAAIVNRGDARHSNEVDMKYEAVNG